MSTTSQSDNEAQSPPAQVARNTRNPRSNPATLQNNRARPYPPALSHQLGSRVTNHGTDTPPPEGGPAGRESPTARPASVGTVRHYGRPGTGVVRPWPPAIVPFETSEAEFNEEYVNLLGRTFNIRAPYMDFAEELVQASQLNNSLFESNHMTLTTIFPLRSLRTDSIVYSCIQSFLSGKQLNRCFAPEMQLRTPQLALRQFHCLYRLKSSRTRGISRQTFVQTRAKEVLMSPALDVYSCDPVRGAPPAGRSLLDQVLEHVVNQSDEFKLDYLPVGFMTGDLAARASLNTELRERLKHERGAMRNLLLTNVHDPSGRPITHPVPSLTSLIIDMTQRMIPGVEQAAAHASNRRLRSRIAHLRIQTISHYARRGGGESNRQWAIIDEQLMDLRGRPALYRRAFYRLIIQLDAVTFGDTLYVDMDVDNIKVPSEEEVLAQMDLMAGERLAAAEVNGGSGEE
ncbi:uncharacterized protein PGTG_20700 [Puccinia graminis f. sp. tritici CRL 75-36-700-3]|uniref:Uncharacterized protein n=2 Tax=Puccinia graminis f. sp. tritici TaxID=56615 RepID=H6QPA1_PUCGT|nr:uncharacterized protein PGTG_20700 [Puccinia graminis f. sp. tritici CRL 75-36-700-3]EHS63606.1 hypothetical protein PGTG_20700 [Puccinia graminis f. sp. tritici CRL 75-36-700-3]